MAAEYKLCGTESDRTGEVHTWITRDGFNLDLEDVHTDLLELQQQVEDQHAEIERLRTLLRAACDSEQSFWDDMLRQYPDMETEYEEWYEHARREVDDE